MHVLLIEGLAFPLDVIDAQWLEQRIRETCIDASHRPRDMDGALACLQLADVLADEPRGRLEPIELTHRQARGLVEYVLVPRASYASTKWKALHEALLQFSSDNV